MAATETVAMILADVETLGASLTPEGADQIRVRPKGVLPPALRERIISNKPALLRVLRGERDAPKDARTRLADVAADLCPQIRATVREDGDHDVALDLFREIRDAVADRPGGNRIAIRIVDAHGTVARVEWRALTDQALRLRLARILRGQIVCEVTLPGDRRDADGRADAGASDGAGRVFAELRRPCSGRSRSGQRWWGCGDH